MNDFHFDFPSTCDLSPGFSHRRSFRFTSVWADLPALVNEMPAFRRLGYVNDLSTHILTLQCMAQHQELHRCERQRLNGLLSDGAGTNRKQASEMVYSASAAAGALAEDRPQPGARTVLKVME